MPGATACSPCPSGSTTTDTGAVDVAECLCLPGYTPGLDLDPWCQGKPMSRSLRGADRSAVDSRRPCRLCCAMRDHVGGLAACAPNTFKAELGNSSCVPCAAGAVTGPGVSTVCVCDAGFGGSAGDACVACSTTQYKAAIGDGPCSACPDNSSALAVEAVNTTECVCWPGYFGLSGTPCEGRPSVRPWTPPARKL